MRKLTFTPRMPRQRHHLALLALVFALAACGGPAGETAANQGEAATGATAGNDMGGDEAANLSDTGQNAY